MYACGSILTAYFSGWLVDKHGPRFVFCVSAAFPLIVCVASLFIKEQQPSHITQDKLMNTGRTGAVNCIHLHCTRWVLARLGLPHCV